MQRVTISIDEPLAEAFDAFVEARAYQSRSEAVRDLVRGAVEHDERDASPISVGVLSYVFNRDLRRLAERLSAMQHAHHDLISANTSLPLDHTHSLVSVLLRGPTAEVRAFANAVLAERGVRSGGLNLVGVNASDRHHHPDDHSHEGHAHLSPRLS